MLMCVGTCECGCEFICLFVYFDRGQPWVSSSETLAMCLRDRFFLGWNSLIRPDGLVGPPQGHTFSAS